MASDQQRQVGLQQKLRFVFESLEWRQLRVRVGHCPVCRARSVIVKLQSYLYSTRCVRCGAPPTAMAMAKVVLDHVSDLSAKSVYEASSRGPFYEFLHRHARELEFSEFFDDVPLGELHNGVRCEDLQALSFPDEHFDLCTNTEVFEHVPDDMKGFGELLRVLRPGGYLIFTVPIFDIDTTLERVKLNGEEKVYLEPPTYHGDVIRGAGEILVYRDYGRDIVDRLRHVGFASAEIVEAGDVSGMGFQSPVVVAVKRETNTLAAKQTAQHLSKR